MTVASETNRSGPYNGNGVTTIFNYDWRIVHESHLRVIKRSAAGVETTLTVDADYIVSDVGSPLGGQIALVAAPAVGETITIIPNVPFTQEIDLENQGAYFAETVERGLDLAAMRDQQLQEQINRAVLIPPAADPETLTGLIEDIIRLGDSADSIDTVADNIGGVGTVADGISSVLTAAENIDAIIAAPHAAEAAEAAAASVNIRYIPDRAALKALNTSVTTVAILGEGLRYGTFKWQAGDYSAKIASDPLEGLYVKADGVAATAGAWVRQGGWAVDSIKTVWFGAVPDAGRNVSGGTGTDSSDAIQAALNLPYNVDLCAGWFKITKTLWTTQENRVVFGHGFGLLYGMRPPNTTRDNFSPKTLLIWSGNGASQRRVITRRKHRNTAADPNDPVMSAGLENHGIGAVFRDFSMELACNYDDKSVTNYGANNWDIAFFNGGRGGTILRNISILGYWRRAGVYFDNTRAYGLPGLYLPDGTQLTRGSDFSSGSDKCEMHGCKIVGARVGLAILGADVSRYNATDYNPVDDSCTIYDWVSNSKIDDQRGVSGFSDFRCKDCDIQSTQHHSGQRSRDPLGYVSGGSSTLSRANMETEADDAPAAVYIDGWAGNSSDGATSTGKGAIRGMVFDVSRIQSFEMFRVRLGQCDEIYFLGRNWWEDGAGAYVRNNEFRDTSGLLLATPNDYDRLTYGHIATHSVYTGLVEVDRFIGGIFTTQWVADRNKRWISTDRDGRIKYPGWNQNFLLNDDTNLNIDRKLLRGYIKITIGSVTGTGSAGVSAFLYFDLDNTPSLISAGHVGANMQLISASTTLTDANVTDGNFGLSPHNGFIQVRNRLGFQANILVTEI